MALGQNISFFVSGYDLATALQSYGVSLKLDELDASVLANSYREFEAGYADGTIKASGVFRSDAVNADEIHEILGNAFNNRDTVHVTTSFGTIAAGDAAFLMNACGTSYGVDMPAGRLVMVDAEMRTKTGLDFGVWLMNVQLDEGSAQAGTGVDNGASTANGGILHAHLANSTATSVSLQLQHSTDGNTWADLTGVLITLTEANEAGAYTVPAGTTINAHTRVVADVVGGDTVLVSAAFARR